MCLDCCSGKLDETHSLKGGKPVQAGWLSWLGRCPMHLKGAGSIPGQGMCRRQPVNVLSLSPTAPLSKVNENIPSGEDTKEREDFWNRDVSTSENREDTDGTASGLP